MVLQVLDEEVDDDTLDEQNEQIDVMLQHVYDEIEGIDDAQITVLEVIDEVDDIDIVVDEMVEHEVLDLELVIEYDDIDEIEVIDI